MGGSTDRFSDVFSRFSDDVLAIFSFEGFRNISGWLEVLAAATVGFILSERGFRMRFSDDELRTSD